MNTSAIPKLHLDTLLSALGMSPSRDNYLKWMVHTTSPMYSCLRPPGASGALLITDAWAVLGYAFPPIGETCKELGECEIEYTVDQKDLEDADLARMPDMHPHCVRTLHAEHHAILRAARLGVATNGATLYSILKPCYQCTKAIIMAGIKAVFYAGAAYDEERTKRIIEQAGIHVEHIEIGLDYGRVK